MLGSCAEQTLTQEETLYVSIAPLQELVAGIVGDDYPIGILVPAGASPETYEPTPRQIVELNRTQLIFNVGLIDFEQALLQKIGDRNKIVDLSVGIEPIAGSCSHAHAGHAHAHGIDPHIWTSPRALQRMAANAYEAIRTRYPDSTKYAANYETLRRRLRELDARTAEKIERSGVKYIVIYHPALAYYARDYGLEQAAIEADGKEPSARKLGETIREARAKGVSKVFYQSQFPASVVETAARDIGARVVRIDPLRADAIANIDKITDLITSE
ncbi:MAG: zinc ABC transporter substrate-binding protein [Alistipes sp.]|nr:zinc ABC transporter substrate-binding protein [Alistipes senegalensis]MCM1249544.1 zinc ABC transporter substrate-binding protein [Alistipes sp.]